MLWLRRFFLYLLLLLGYVWQLTQCTEIYEVGEQFSAPRRARIRKEFTSMSFKERKRFVRAYKMVSITTPYKRHYEYLVGLHKSLFKKVHVEKQFFPWHRWYLLQFENLLRRADPRVTLPYWDWSIRSQKLWGTGKRDLWNSYPWGLGGNGTGEFTCVEDGPFGKKSWRLTRGSGGGCLRRNFIGRMPSIVAIHTTLRYAVQDFKKFEKKIRQLYHNELHCCIQGTMELPSASNTPEFLLHHAFMDKLWYDWQGKGPEFKFKIDEEMTARLRGSHYRIGHFMDSDNLGYTGIAVHYRDPFSGYKYLHATLNRLDNKALQMLDSYGGEKGKRCCPETDEDISLKAKEIDESLGAIPLEKALDYGEDNIIFEQDILDLK